MRKLILVTAFTAFTAFGPAHATDGRTAVGMCIDSTASGARCVWNVNDKGEIDICNKNGCVYCKNAEATCSVALRRPKPNRSLPVGTLLGMGLGMFEVAPSRSFNFGLCRRGEIRCPLFGCVPTGQCEFQR